MKVGDFVDFQLREKHHDLIKSFAKLTGKSPFELAQMLAKYDEFGTEELTIYDSEDHYTYEQLLL